MKLRLLQNGANPAWVGLEEAQDRPREIGAQESLIANKPGGEGPLIAGLIGCIVR